MPQNAFFLRTRDLLVSRKTTHFFCLSPTLHPLSTVISATAAVLAFVLLRNSRSNFHCYTQREAKPTQKSARKCAATSRDFLLKRLQSAFTLANQLRWMAQVHAVRPFWLSLCPFYLFIYLFLVLSTSFWGCSFFFFFKQDASSRYFLFFFLFKKI